VLRRRRARRKGTAIFTACVVALLGVAAYLAYSAYQHVTPLLAGPGCQAGRGTSAVSLDPQQAGIAATIAAVAASERLPAHAVTVAYATAMQESHMHDLAYGDQDSVGVFQQRPSEGWGTASELEDPVYATSRFFGALIRVPGWLDLPVDQAAQAVQHSADGSAYSQYDPMAAALTSAYTGEQAHAVWCWPGPGPQPRQNLPAAGTGLDAAFGATAAGRPVTSFTVSRSAETAAAAVRVQPADAWTVASWLVTHAAVYGLTDVRYDGYQWTAAAGSQGWRPETRAPPPPAGPSGDPGATSATSGSILLH
jgi:hypothetical protein